MRRDLASIVLNTSTDDKRVTALLELIDLSVFSKYQKQVEGELNIHEETCEYCNNKDCWLNIPDSVAKCSGKCENYKRRHLI